MNNNLPLTDLRVIFSNGTNKYAQFGCVSTTDGWKLKQVGSFRSDDDAKEFTNVNDFKAAIKKHLTNSKADIYRLVIDQQQLWFDKYDSIGQGFAKNVLELMLNKVN